jgi:shikimate 5-dehydrogenase
VGTGGAARAALVALRGAQRMVTGRDAAKCQALAQALGALAIAPGDVARARPHVLVHATPQGSRALPGALPVDPAALREGLIVLDAVYRPRETPLLVTARARGAVAIPGSEWFLRQALAQFQMVTGREAPAATMAAALDAALAAEDG